MPSQSIELGLASVTKNYGRLRALDSVELHLEPGRIHAVVGENGAGKSTAMKILAGLEQPSAGTVLIDGAAATIPNRTAAIRRGIGLVPQQLSLIGEMSLVENLALTSTSRLARRKVTEARLADVVDGLRLSLDLRIPVRNLGLAERQFGELAIALAQGARALLLDEPTSAIGPHESHQLFEKIRGVARLGVSVLLITHRLDEVRSVAENVTVLSQGRVTLDAQLAAVNDEQLVKAMVGEIPTSSPRAARATGQSRLVFNTVTARGEGAVAIRDVGFSVAAREIVGVLGVAGNGQSTLAATAAGLVAPVEGSITVDGVSVGGRPDLALANGLSYVPEVRGEALLLDSQILRSAPLRQLNERRYRRRGALAWAEIAHDALALMEHHDVRPRTLDLPAGAYSGGNQQKFLVGRELDGVPTVAVLHGPTQGLDLHAAVNIRAAIRRAADAGTAILLVSADIDEVRELADRVLVLSAGRIVDSLYASEFDLERIGRAMAGLLEPPARMEKP